MSAFENSDWTTYSRTYSQEIKTKTGLLTLIETVSPLALLHCNASQSMTPFELRQIFIFGLNHGSIPFLPPGYSSYNGLTRLKKVRLKQKKLDKVWFKIKHHVLVY